MNRSENLRRLANEEFDLCIIGGGASGAGCALDAALRGLKVALIEKTDFAAETSSRSTKLVHGGVRYLEQAFKKLDFAQLRQVRHGLEERRGLLHNAPHLARPLGLLTPVFSWWEGAYFTIGLKLYDWFAKLGNKKQPGQLPSSRWLSKKEALNMMPGLSPNIHSAVLYFDGQMDDARYCLALVQSANELPNCVVANHLEVTGFQNDQQGKLSAANVQDTLEDKRSINLKASCFINCTGPFADHIRLLANPHLSPRISPSKGVHLVLPSTILQSDQAMLIPKTPDGRMVFAIPFEGSILLGTTDEPYKHPHEEPVLEATELNYLLDTLQPFVAKKLDKSLVKSGFGGIRPLLKPAISAPHRPTKSLLRDHEVEVDPLSGLISLLGGKWTTYRLMARDAIDAACQQLTTSGAYKNASLAPAASTASYTLFGSRRFSSDIAEKLEAEYGLNADICRHLAAKYGDQATVLGNLTLQDVALAGRILPNFPFIKAQIVYAVREEMALTIRDFLARRIRLEPIDWEAAKQAAHETAQWMGATLKWTELEKQDQLSAYLSLLETFSQRASIDSAFNEGREPAVSSL